MIDACIALKSPKVVCATLKETRVVIYVCIIMSIESKYNFLFII